MSGSGPDELSRSVVRAVAAAKGVEPSELEFRLQDEIDADALDALGGHEGGPWTIEFEVDGHLVAVDHEGSVAVDGTRYRDEQ